MRDKDAQLMMEGLSEAWKDQWPTDNQPDARSRTADAPRDAVGARVRSIKAGQSPGGATSNDEMVVTADHGDSIEVKSEWAVRARPEAGSTGPYKKKFFVVLPNQPQYAPFFPPESSYDAEVQRDKDAYGRRRAQRMSDEQPLGYGPGVSPSVGGVRLDSIKPL